MKLEAVNAHANQGVEAFPVKDVSQLLKCVVKSKMYLFVFILCVLLCAAPQTHACSVGWFVSLLVREEVLLAGLCERKILF